jgi:hypothetical protein
MAKIEPRHRAGAFSGLPERDWKAVSRLKTNVFSLTPQNCQR